MNFTKIPDVLKKLALVDAVVAQLDVHWMAVFSPVTPKDTLGNGRRSGNSVQDHRGRKFPWNSLEPFRTEFIECRLSGTVNLYLAQRQILVRQMKLNFDVSGVNYTWTGEIRRAGRQLTRVIKVTEARAGERHSVARELCGHFYGEVTSSERDKPSVIYIHVSVYQRGC